MKVFVLGGTGAIGRCTLPALIEAGHEVAALARTPEKAAWVSAQGAQPVTVSIFDRDSLSRCFVGSDAVVNLATSMPSTWKFALRRAWKPTERVRIEGSAAVVDAALSARVGRLLQESVCMIYPDRSDRWIDEDVPPDSYPNAKGNLAAEASAHRFTAAGGTGVIMRLGLFYGPTAQHSREFLAMARRHVVPVFGNPDSYLSSIHIEDGAQGVVAALAAPAGIFNIVDNEPLTKLDYALALATAVGIGPPLVRAPGRLALLLGDRLTSLTRSLRVSNRRFREATGWQPRYPTARQGWIATARALT